MPTQQQPELVEAIFSCPPVYNAIFACLSPPDIYRARTVCRLFSDAVVHFHDLAYNINRHLSHFFKDPTAFRNIQANCHFLISGSNALQFLDRTLYPESDLDLFAYPKSVKDIGRHLIKVEGYEFLPGDKQPKVFEQVIVKDLDRGSIRRSESQHAFVYTSGMSDLFRFKRPFSDVEVQIISVSRSPLDCILYFHSCTSLIVPSCVSLSDPCPSMCDELYHSPRCILPLSEGNVRPANILSLRIQGAPPYQESV